MKIRKNGKVINLTESDLRRIVKRVISEQKNSGFSKYAQDRFDEEGFKKVSDTEYKNDKRNAVVKLKSCGEYDGFTYFKNGKKIYEGCPDACWTWWYKNVSKELEI